MNHCRLIRLAVLAMLGVALASCVTAVPSGAPDKPTVWVMRHLETDETPERHLASASAGQAERLGAYLASQDIGAVWVTDTARARETGAPTAARMGLAPRVYDHNDPDGLLATIAEEGVPALIVGHSNTAPDIAQRLGAPAEQADRLVEYGMVLRSGPRGTELWSIADLSETRP